MATAPPLTKAYLLKSRSATSWVDVELQLGATNLRCVTRDCSKRVDEVLELADYRSKLAVGEPVVIFDLPRDELVVTWLRQFYRGGFQLRRGDSRPWLIALGYPSGFGGVLDLMTDRAVWRQWRAVLPDTKGRR